MGFTYDLGILLPLYFVLVLLNGFTIQHKHSNEINRFYRISSFPSTNASVNGSQPYRTAFHFQPPRNWMNDPNGPMVYKGIYHLFYQYNPKGPVWGNIVWGHSTSTDLINWQPQPEAISPSIPSDINGCFSGSATILADGKPAILYTGSFNSQNDQMQNLVVPKDPSDPYLKEWVKLPQNPIMTATPANKINSSEFRDPTTAWLLSSDGAWRVAVGAEIEGRGMALLYRSKDFIGWTEAVKPLHSIEGSGMWECPDFYPVYISGQVGADTSAALNNQNNDTKVVLKASLAATSDDAYLIGSYDVRRDIFVPDKEDKFRLRYDYGKFYASKSFFDSVKKRRVLWGWVDEMSSKTDNIEKGWAGIQSFPRTILLDESGDQLLQWPVEEIELLRGKQVDLGGSRFTGGSLIEVSGITAAQADVEISFKMEDFNNSENFDPSWTNPQLLCSERGASVRGGLGPFGLMVLASEELEEYTAVFFRVFRNHENNSAVVLMCSDQSRSSLSSSNDMRNYGTFVKLDSSVEELSLRILIDHSIVESFGVGGRNCITARIYPTLAVNDKAYLYAFNNGTESVQITKLRAWSMKEARMN